MAATTTPAPRRWHRQLLAAVGFVAGSVLSWLLLALLWIEFDTLIPLWTGACAVSIAAVVALLRARDARLLATAAGALMSAVLVTMFWTWLSSGPAFT